MPIIYCYCLPRDGHLHRLILGFSALSNVAGYKDGSLYVFRPKTELMAKEARRNNGINSARQEW